MYQKIAARFFSYWNEKPLLIIVLGGFLIRLLSVIFSKGFGMWDDHFLVIEAAQSWIDNTDYNNWLPKAGQTIPTPSGHSFFYPGIHYLLFRFLEFFGIENPQSKMYAVRFLHACYSLLTIIYGYKIAEKVAEKKIAKQVGLLLSFCWFIPFLSVRNLVEVACIPPLMLATWFYVKDENKNWWKFLSIGLLLGIAFNIRFQTIFFTGGFGLAILLQRKIVPAILVGIGFIACASGFQGLCDYFVWHQPFVEFREYVRYNLENATTYFNAPWYNYMLLLAGIFIPPISVFLLFGFFKNFKKHLILFLPSFMFLAFHSYFPNKQERFILPIVPFIILLGTIGWIEFEAQSIFWQKRKKIMDGILIFFWVVNTILLLVVSVAYTKRNRVETMSFLEKKGDTKSLIIDDRNRDDFTLSPQFYLHKWVQEYGVSNQTNTDELCKNLLNLDVNKRPNYIVFYQKENLENRKLAYEKYFDIKYETTVEPSFIDDFMYKLNPYNLNCYTYIYKIEGIKK